MLAVHEEKITQQEDLQTRSIQEFNTDVKELHGRITDTQKELTALMTEQHQSQTQALVKLKEDISSLDKWRYMIIGGAIVVGFIIQSATKYLT
jgi:DNA mismatch repair ATPase MutS